MSKTDKQLTTFQILAIFGILIFLIGLFAVFYKADVAYWESYQMHYPYRDIGIILTVTGIALTALGLILHERKTT